MKKNQLLLISLLSIALWHCGNKKEEPGDNAPDLIVMDIMPSSTNVTASKMIMLEAMVSNTGKGSSSATTLRWYLSTDDTIDIEDTEIEMTDINELAAGESSTVPISIAAPKTAGTNHYGACVDSVTGESDTNNNCSSAVMITVTTSDFTINISPPGSTLVATSAMITLEASVRNAGESSAMATTLRWYLSTDSTIDTNDTEVEMTELNELAAGERRNVSASITAPNETGTNHYGVCVESVTSESDTTNNCSLAVMITVVNPGMHLSASDFMLADANEAARGIWSDGNTLWVLDSSSNKIYAYDLASKAHDSTKDITLDTENTDSEGLWSDGVTIWVSDFQDDKVYAYNLASKARVPIKDFDTLSSANNESPSGLWSDGVTLWVADWGETHLYAYNLLTKARDPDKEIDLNSANSAPRRIWSDGVTMWVADLGDNIYAYTLATKARDAAKEFTNLRGAGNTDAGGLWSDGVTLWVADSTDRKVYAYEARTLVDTSSLTSLSTKLAGIAAAPDFIVTAPSTDIPHASTSAVITLKATVSNLGGPSSMTTLRWYRSDDNSLDTSADTSSGTKAVESLTAGASQMVSDNMVTTPSMANTYYYFACVESVTDEYYENDNCSSGTAVIVVNPGSHLDASDFSLDTQNADASGIWSNGVTLWVADQVDNKIYAYDLDTKARDSDKDITLDTENGGAEGIWSDGVTIWVSDFQDDKIYAYDLASKAYVPAKDFNTLNAAGNASPSGIWSNGVTLWVADWGDTKLYAYNLVTKAHDSDKDIDLESANSAPRRIWSDGVTLWVADLNDNIYAYTLATKARDAAKDFTNLDDAGNEEAGGIWSDGETLWVADSTDDKVYAYYARTWVDTSMLTSISTKLAEIAAVPDLIVTAPSTDIPHASTSAMITLTATVSNLGGASSPMTNLNWYRSDDNSLDTSADTASGMKAVESLTARASQMVSDNMITAPSMTGTYYYFACVESVTDEYYENDNCSSETAVIVANSGDYVSDSDFSLATDNADPRGVWLNTTTMWVADTVDNKLYAYDLVTNDRDSSKDFTLDTENGGAEGIWSNGTTMWVADHEDDKIYAYKMSDRTRDSAKDFNTLDAAENESPSGIWSNGTTMWVADWDDTKLYAYILDTKARDSDKDIDLDSENSNPRGIWSDGTTIWVADLDKNLYAYTLATKAYDSTKNFTNLNGAGNTKPSGISSDGVTLWVVDTDDDKLYAYRK